MSAPSDSAWPTGHAGWIFSGLAEFEGHAAFFLAEGLRQGERIVFAAEDPGVKRWPKQLLSERVLLLGSVTDGYAPLRDGDLEAQRSRLDRAAREALYEGFTGLRVVADCTRIVEENPERWIEWEHLIEEVITESPVTALCGFDRARLADETVDRVVWAHRRTVGL